MHRDTGYSCSFSGCNKGKNTAAKKAEINKALSTADTADIFKEFYSEDTAKKVLQKNIR